jgi:hypothetical protein
LGQYCLDDGGPCLGVVAAAMKAVVKVDCI